MAYRQWCSTPLCWLDNVAQVASLPLCPSLLNSGTALNPPFQKRNSTIAFTLQHPWINQHIHACGRLTYLVGSSRFWSFIWAGMVCVARGPEAYGWGSCPLNSDWMKCSCQLEIRESFNDWKCQNTFSILYYSLKSYAEVLDTDLFGKRKLLGNRCHSLPTHTLTGLPSGTEWRVGSLAIRWNSGYRSRGAW